MKNLKEIYEALLNGKVLVESNGSRVKLSKCGTCLMGHHPLNDSWHGVHRTFGNTEDWSIYEEPRKPRKALAYINGSGEVTHVIEGSDLADSYKVNMALARAPGFDIEESK